MKFSCYLYYVYKHVFIIRNWISASQLWQWNWTFFYHSIIYLILCQDNCYLSYSRPLSSFLWQSNCRVSYDSNCLFSYARPLCANIENSRRLLWNQVSQYSPEVMTEQHNYTSMLCGPNSAYQQSFFWSDPWLSIINLVVLRTLIKSPHEMMTIWQKKNIFQPN